MSLFDMFTKTPEQAPAQQPAQQVPAQPGNLPAQAPAASNPAPNAEPNGTVPNQPEGEKSNSPLAEYEKLWEPNPTDPNAPAAPKDTPLDPAAVHKAVASADFSKVITADNLAAITAGGEEASKAFVNSMNAVAQQVLAQSTLVNNKMTEQAVKKALEQHSAGLPEMLRSQAAADHLKTSNPIFSNPAVTPIIEATQTQLLQKFPNATAAELTKMTNDYILAMGQAFAPAPPVDPNAPVETNWDTFLNN